MPTKRLPQLPGYPTSQIPNAINVRSHLQNDRIVASESEKSEETYLNTDRRGSRQVQFTPSALGNTSYALSSPTLASAYSKGSPAQDCFPPKCIFETLRNQPAIDHQPDPIPHFPQSNMGSERSCLTTTQNSSEGRISRYTRSSTTARPLKSPTIPSQRSQRETEAQLAWLGYKQELYRDWDFWSSFSLSCSNIGLFPGAFWGLPVALTVGGPIIMTWGFFLSMFFMVCLNAVLAEMSSAYPVTGAMFTWTFKLARANPRFRDWARLFSWIVGFLMTVAHVLTAVQMAVQFMDVFVSIFTGSGYHWRALDWQRYLIGSGWLLLCGVIACTRTARSPTTWKVLGVVNVIACTTMCVALLATAKHQRPFHTLFTRYENKSTFKNKFWVFIYGSANATLCIGSEPAAHLAEETKDAASTVPRVMFWSTIITYVISFAMYLTVIKTLVPGHYHTPSTWPVVDLVFLHCPKPVAQMVVGCLLITMFLEDMSQILTAGRFFWALARDSAIPYAKFWRRTSTEYRIPRRATLLLVVVSVLTSATNLEKTSTLPILLTQAVAVLIAFCYIVPLVLYVSGDQDAMDLDGRNVWRMRSLSRPLTWVSLIFLVGVFVIFSSPSKAHITAQTWTWSPLVLLGLILISMVLWMLYGQLHYAGPVKSLTIWTAGQEVELPKKSARVMVPAPIAVSNARVTNRSIATCERATTNQDGMLSHQTYDLPGAYCTYNSDGSMWCDTEVEHQQSSVF